MRNKHKKQRKKKLANGDSSTSHRWVDVSHASLRLRVVGGHFLGAILRLEWRNAGADVFGELGPDGVPPGRIVLGDFGKIVSEGGAGVAVVEGEKARRVGLAERVRLAPRFGVSLGSSSPPVHEA